MDSDEALAGVVVVLLIIVIASFVACTLTPDAVIIQHAKSGDLYKMNGQYFKIRLVESVIIDSSGVVIENKGKQ